MIIAAMMSMMLMPAQMMAKDNRNNAKPRVENRVKKNDKKVPNIKFDNARPGNAENKKVDKGRKQMPQVAKRAQKPMPKPMPKPRPRPVPPRRPIYNNYCCDNGFVEAAATVIGLAALIAAVAD